MKSQHIASRTANPPSAERKTATFKSSHARRHPVTRVRRQTRGGLRARVDAAFRNMAHGCSPKEALARSKDFYRSGGKAWTRHLG